MLYSPQLHFFSAGYIELRQSYFPHVTAVRYAVELFQLFLVTQLHFFEKRYLFFQIQGVLLTVTV